MLIIFIYAIIKLGLFSRLVVLVLVNKAVNAIHDLRNKVNDSVNSVACRRSDIDHAHTTVLNYEEADGVNLNTGSVAAAIGLLIALGVKFYTAAAKADADFGNG